MMDTANLPGENCRNCMAVSKPQSSSLYADGKWTVPGICILLAVAVFVVFGQTIRHEFVNYDDDDYVYNNPPVKNGLTLPDIKWAFTHSHSLNWHPLTWLSHMLDCQLYGLNAGGHHLSNVLLHAATTILLFLVLRRMAGFRPGNSAGESAAQAGRHGLPRSWPQCLPFTHCGWNRWPGGRTQGRVERAVLHADIVDVCAVCGEVQSPKSKVQSFFTVVPLLLAAVLLCWG